MMVMIIQRYSPTRYEFGFSGSGFGRTMLWGMGAAMHVRRQRQHAIDEWCWWWLDSPDRRKK
jgi:hypothetical protein